jgi:hypothetical protein
VVPDPVGEWLASIGFERYCDVLKCAFFDNFESLVDLDEQTMGTIGIGLGHQKMLLRKIADKLKSVNFKL